MLSKDYLAKCLNTVAGRHRTTVDEVLLSMYYPQLMDFTNEQVGGAFITIQGDNSFPSPERIIELITGVRKDDDWYKVIAVSSGKEKNAEISAVSFAAFTKIFGCNTPQGVVAKLELVEQEKLTWIKKEWLEEVTNLQSPARKGLTSLPSEKILIEKTDLSYKREQEIPVANREDIIQSLKNTLSKGTVKPSTALNIVAKGWTDQERQEIIDWIVSLGLEIPDKSDSRRSGNLFSTDFLPKNS